jgi:hypothetical protein
MLWNPGLEILSAMVLLSLAILVLQWWKRRKQSALATDPNQIALDRRAVGAVVAVLGIGLVCAVMIQWLPQFAATPGGSPPQPETAIANPTSPPPGNTPPPDAQLTPPPATPPPNRPYLRGDGSVAGVVRAFNYGPAGTVDGLILSSGVIAHFPPDQSSQVTPIAPIGAHVQIRGRLQFGPAGDRVVDAQSITNRQTGASINLAAAPVRPPPPPPPGL